MRIQHNSNRYLLLIIVIVMRLVLRNYERLSYRARDNNDGPTRFSNSQYSQTSAKRPQYQKRLSKYPKPDGRQFAKGEPEKQQTQQEALASLKQIQMQYIKEQMEGILSDDPCGLKMEGTSHYLPNGVMLPDYELLKPLNKRETARELIKKYEQNLNLSMDKHILPKLYEEDRYLKRVAKYHLSEMAPLTGSFIRQGYNFLDKKVILHLLQKGQMKVVKQLLLEGAFESTYAVDDQVLAPVLATYLSHERNHFLVNIIPYHLQLITGDVRVQPIKDAEQLLGQHIDERSYFTMMYLSNGSPVINKLRLLWALQKKYLQQYNLMEFIVPELKKIRFVTEDPQAQILANKEVNFTLTTVFQSEIFEDFFYRVLQTTKTYPNFFKAWSIIILLFSKLRSIPRVLDQASRTQLHPFFQLIQLNLPKDISQPLLEEVIFEFLIYEDHSRIQFQNYLSCMTRWEQTYLQPQTTLYNSHLTSIVGQSSRGVTVTYRQQQKAEPFAITTFVLQKSKRQQKPAVTTQAQVIRNLLRGNYQSVFDDFLVRYSLPSNFEMASNFHKKLKQVDRSFSFRSKDEQALYKLKQAYNFFFIDSLPNPLKRQDLQPYKLNLGVISNLDHAVLKGKMFLDDEEILEVENHRKEVQKEIEDLVRQTYGKYLGDFASEDTQDAKESESEQYELKNPKQSEIQDKYTQDLKIIEKHNEIIKILKKNNTYKGDYHVAEWAELLEELLDNKLITKTYFDQFKQLSPQQAKEEGEKLVANYERFYKSKLEEARIQNESEGYQQQTKPAGETSQALKSKSRKKRRQDKLKKADTKAQPKANQQLSEGQNQFQKNLSKQNDQNQESSDLSEDVQSGSTELDSEHIQDAVNLIQHNMKQHQTQIDGALDDRALYFALELKQYREVYKVRHISKERQQIQPIQIQLGTSQQGVRKKNKKGYKGQIQQDEKTLNQKEKSQKQVIDELIEFLRPIQYYQQGPSFEEMIKAVNAPSQAFYNKKSQDETSQTYIDSSLSSSSLQSQMSQEPQKKGKKRDEKRDWKRSTNQLFSKQNKQSEVVATKKREVGFFKKIKPGFCTARVDPVEENNTNLAEEKNTNLDEESSTSLSEENNRKLTEENNSKRTLANLFDLQKIEIYRKQEVSRDFYNLMQLQDHIPRVGEGNKIAKYLFLQGQRQDGKGRVNPNRVMTIQFGTIVGTRTKSYEKYIKNTLYNFQLQDSFYKSLLEDQLKAYNRNQFKLIIAHLIHYKTALPDEIVSLICQICEKQLIGYSLVEIAQFIKANSIALSSAALQNLAKNWQRFDIINEDLLPYLREYCLKMTIPFKTQYYAHFVKSLIIDKKFTKLQALCDVVFAEIRPKTFKAIPGTGAAEVQALEKVWKQTQNDEYSKLYLELIETIVINLDTSNVPEFIVELYDDYIKLRPSLNQKELGYGMVCYCKKRQKFIQLLIYLEKNPHLGTSFMYDCSLQALLSNFQDLQEYAERILDVSLIVNRIVLSKEQILKSMVIFKKAATSNAFSKFLDHCLRFQVDINKLPEVKKEMFYVLNNNVEEVSVAGIFNLLDFIFNEKREKERTQYRALRLSQEQKQRRLNQIQKVTLVKKVDETAKISSEEKTSSKEKKKETTEQKSQASETNQSENSAKNTKSQKKVQKAEKKVKKQKAIKKESQNRMVDQILSEQQALSMQAENEQKSTSFKDDDIIGSVKVQTKKHQSYKRKSIKKFGFNYETVIQDMEAEQMAIKQKQEKAKLGAKQQKSAKKVTKGKSRQKN